MTKKIRKEKFTGIGQVGVIKHIKMTIQLTGQCALKLNR